MARRKWVAIVLGACGGVGSLAGCSEDVRLAGHNIRSVTVGPATQYGVTLDKSASPEEVAFVLLRAIRDDFRAADRAERESALDKQFAVCAANEIQKRNSTGSDRDAFVYKAVWLWTPTVSHYCNDFETDWAKAKARFVRDKPAPGKDGAADQTECKVRMAAADPGGDPNAGAVLSIQLVKDSGYWRVLRIGFEPAARSIEDLQAAGGKQPDAGPSS